MCTKRTCTLFCWNMLIKLKSLLRNTDYYMYNFNNIYKFPTYENIFTLSKTPFWIEYEWQNNLRNFPKVATNVFVAFHRFDITTDKASHRHFFNYLGVSAIVVVNSAKNPQKFIDSSVYYIRLLAKMLMFDLFFNFNSFPRSKISLIFNTGNCISSTCL